MNAPLHLAVDLDDTLYPERDYVSSCFAFASQLVEQAYGCNGVQLRLDDCFRQGCADPIKEVLTTVGVPDTARAEIVSAMRAHVPSIKLDDGARRILESMLKSRRAVSVITDGRSLTQRRKLQALGLIGAVEPYISEELGHSKSSPAAFEAVMAAHPQASSYWYVGDNPSKDFVHPNRLGWETVMISTEGRGVHCQVPPSDAHRARYVIKSWEELRELPEFR